jgi:hypothetical protein
VLLFTAIQFSAHCQTNSAFPAFSSSLTNYIPSTASLGQVVNVRAGYGFNLNSNQKMTAAAAEFSISPSLSFGGVASYDETGWCAGGVTLGINGSVNLPLLGKVNCFAGEGVAYDFKYKAPANYLFTGVERPFSVGKYTLAPGISLANTSTRAGTIALVGLGITF